MGKRRIVVNEVNDLYNELFRNTIAGRPLLDCEKSLQRIAVKECMADSNKATGYKYYPVDTFDVRAVKIDQIDEHSQLIDSGCFSVSAPSCNR